MKNERVMKKIIKCLALGKSSNEHEAAIALKQAKALMEKHNLTMNELELSTIDVVEVGGSSKRPPRWTLGLYSTAAHAFGCSLFIKGGRPVFVGTSPAPDIAAYSVDVLLRQLNKNKIEFMESIKSKSELTRSAAIMIGKGFSEGWVLGCNKVVCEFAAELSGEVKESHLNKIQSHFGRAATEGKEGKSALDNELGNIAASAGFHNGLNAKIHTGMGTDGKPLSLETNNND